MADKQDWLIEEAFAFYCSADIDTPAATLIGQRTVNMIVEAAKRSNRKLQSSIFLGTTSATLVAMTFSDLNGGLFVGFVAVAVLGMFATICRLYSKPHEPSHQDLLGSDLTPEQAQAVAALKEFRRLLVDGSIVALPSSSTSPDDFVPPALFAVDGGRLLILGIGDRSAIKSWKRKPVGAIRVQWVPQRHVPIGDGSATNAPQITPQAAPHCVNVLEDVQPADFAIWRDELVSKARGKTAERLRGVLDAMYATAIDTELCRFGNIIDRILKRLDGAAPYRRETVDKIVHGTKSAREYAYILRYLIARKSGELVRIETGKRGHPDVQFCANEVTP